MSTCERTTMETHTKEDLEVLADYIENIYTQARFEWGIFQLIWL